jgi:hypothetical protein
MRFQERHVLNVAGVDDATLSCVALCDVFFPEVFDVGADADRRRD